MHFDKPISRRSFVVAAAAAAAQAAEFRSVWRADLSRPWLGPDYWANPMQDWRVRNGRLECHAAGGDRNVFLLTREAGRESGDLLMSVRLGRLEEDRGPLGAGFVGFRTGIRGRFRDYRDDAVHGVGIDSGITADGRLFIGAVEPNSMRVSLDQQNLLLRLRALPAGADYDAVLEVVDGRGQPLAQIRKRVPADWLEGGLALVATSGANPELPDRTAPLPPGGQNRKHERRGGGMRFWFLDWEVSGDKIIAHPDRAFGPIFFTMYTLSRGVLKLSAQLAPLEVERPEALLQVRIADRWRTIARAHADPLSRTATFRVPGWDDAQDIPYRVVLARQDEQGRPVEHAWEGIIRKDPRDKPRFVIGALTCTNDLGFPHQDVVRSLRHFNPDILLFTGDQIYERVGGYGIQMEPLEAAALDYLRKWLLFGWSFRELMRDTPTVTIPDDHDVYHGNVWGAGGKKAVIDESDPETAINRNKSWQDSGGYKMPPAWVNMVQRTQTSHLPDPYDPTPVEQGIGVYYTSLLYGGVSFAILEDRKWKSPPRKTIPWADIQNGWAQNPKYDAVRDGDVPGAELLGERQLRFLEQWAADWSQGAWMKVAVSQTLWANLCTLPPPANNDDVTPGLPLLRPGEYAEGERLVQDHDSNGWPQTPRTRALRLLRKALAFHIGGDQHLGSTLQYGIDGWTDGPWVICTPAVSNIWPRRWYPPAEGKNRPSNKPRYCGQFLDGFGNKITVHAVANPQHYGEEPAALFDRAVGYGIVELERARRTITFANWPRFVDPGKAGARPYAGWPITIHQQDNGLAGAPYELDPITAPEPDLGVQVVQEASNQIVYTLRISGRRFTPRVFEEGRYTVRILKDTRAVRVLRGLPARRREQ